jgi:hypothetical protein
MKKAEFTIFGCLLSAGKTMDLNFKKEKDDLNFESSCLNIKIKNKLCLEYRVVIFWGGD